MGLGLEIGLVVFLVLVNAAFAGSEMALVSLRDGQLRKLSKESKSGEVLARLAREPNRFLATVQIGITLAGFLASATAAVSLAQPLVGPLSFLGEAAEPVAIVIVTLVLAFVTLVFGELAPKRLAMQRAERWGLIAARPLQGISRLTKPVVWLLAKASDVTVTLFGGDPDVAREEITNEELRELVASQAAFTPDQRSIIEGAFEIAHRTLHEVLRPRREIISIDESAACEEAMTILVTNGHRRAPVISGEIDRVVGFVTALDLVGKHGPITALVRPVTHLPESMLVLAALSTLQRSRQSLAMVVDEYGGTEGLVTVKDLVEEIVGEIYDETDRDIQAVEHRDDGTLVLPGTFPFHDLPEIDIDLPHGPYATVAGFVLSELGYVPDRPGSIVDKAGWSVKVLEVDHRAITKVEIFATPRSGRSTRSVL